MNSSKCDLGSKCGATIARISGKYLKIMGSNLDDLMSLDGLNKIINKETQISNDSKDQAEEKKKVILIQVLLWSRRMLLRHKYLGAGVFIRITIQRKFIGKNKVKINLMGQS